jgi:hypothetical protein
VIRGINENAIAVGWKNSRINKDDLARIDGIGLEETAGQLQAFTIPFQELLHFIVLVRIVPDFHHDFSFIPCV